MNHTSPLWDATSRDLWSAFVDRVKELNVGSKHDERYCVLILGRHGEGEHNVAEAKYGTAAWDVRKLFDVRICF